MTPTLSPPTTRVRESFLEAAGELVAEGVLIDFRIEEARDFDAYVNERRVVRDGWGVPYTELWYVDGDDYLGTLVIRHRLTPELLEAGGHIGYHVAPKHRGHGHATRMLHDGLRFCSDLGLTSVLVTTDESNIASRHVIEANGGELEDIRGSECRYWIATDHW